MKVLIMTKNNKAIDRQWVNKYCVDHIKQCQDRINKLDRYDPDDRDTIRSLQGAQQALILLQSRIEDEK